MLNTLFGPLGKNYCLYFYVMSAMSFSLFLLYVLYIIISVIKNPSKMNIPFVMHSLFILMYSLLGYFVNRLLYTMCVNSV